LSSTNISISGWQANAPAANTLDDMTAPAAHPMAESAGAVA
jgi:hypothetical protein